MQQEYIVQLYVSLKVEATTSYEAQVLALEEVKKNPRRLGATTSRMPSHASYQELRSYLPPENLDDIPF